MQLSANTSGDEFIGRTREELESKLDWNSIYKKCKENVQRVLRLWKEIAVSSTKYTKR